MSGETVSDNPGQSSLFGLQPPGGLAPPINVAQAPVSQSSAGTSTTAGALEQSSIEQAENSGVPPPNSSARTDPANPTPEQVKLVSDYTNNIQSGKELDHAVEITNLSIAFGASDPELVANQVAVNPFLGGIYAVVLEQIMALVVKMDSYRERADSQAYLSTQSQQKEMAVEKAEYQIEAGKTEMYTCFAKALCCAAQVGISAGVAVGSAWKGPRTSTGAAITQTGMALGGIAGQDSIASNMAQGIGAYQKSTIEAQITLLDYSMQVAQQTQDRIEQDRKDTADAKNQMLQAYTQWMNALYSFTQKG